MEKKSIQERTNRNVFKTQKVTQKRDSVEERQREKEREWNVTHRKVNIYVNIYIIYISKEKRKKIEIKKKKYSN